MVELAKLIIDEILKTAERDTGVARAPVSLIRKCAVTRTGAKIPKTALKQARKEMRIVSYEIEGVQYWERGKS